jgi:GNAT superfamily N-acetyltransferase
MEHEIWVASPYLGKFREIFLKEKWLKKGLASELFEHAVAWFRECGCEYVALVVFAQTRPRACMSIGVLLRSL